MKQWEKWFRHVGILVNDVNVTFVHEKNKTYNVRFNDHTKYQLHCLSRGHKNLKQKVVCFQSIQIYCHYTITTFLVPVRDLGHLSRAIVLIIESNQT